jgi:hypothetical protein
MGSRFQNFLDQKFRIVHAQNEDFCLRGKFANLASGFNSVQQRHADIEHSYVRLEPAGFLHRFTAIRGFCAHLPARLGLEESPESRAHNVMVIRYQDANRH